VWAALDARGDTEPATDAEDVDACHELAFFTFFSLFNSSRLRSLLFKFLILSSNHNHSNHFVFSLCSQINKTRCIESHKVADRHARTTTDGPFQDKTKRQALWIMGLSPRQDKRTYYPIEDRRLGTIGHQGRDQGITLFIIKMNRHFQTS
jgi:hypothetical protein